MIVQCPNCLKKYRIGEMKTALVRVRCKACSSEFLVSPTKSSAHEMGHPGEKLTALVADIQRDLRNSVVEILQRNAFHIFIADDGETALELVKREKPNLLFVNPYLPKLMGIDLIEKIRAEVEDPPIIFLIGAIHNSRRYRRRPESLYGADDYLDEGFKEESFLRKLNYHLDIPFSISDEEPQEDRMAHRLARVVFTDLLVYDPERMGKVASVEDFFNIFQEEVAEGKRYIEERAPGKGNILRSVVADYVKRQAIQSRGSQKK